MKKLVTIVAFINFAILQTVISEDHLSSSNAQEDLSKQIWEYKVVTIKENKAYLVEAELNELGKEGWELVEIQFMNSYRGPWAYLKRKVPQNQSR